ncbi:MAG TPA: nuclear transport factor 2 family protein [Sphingomicrobium sp.]|nr:nuclear transport factor 2 family protein [Sphingomicrobium sp.]
MADNRELIEGLEREWRDALCSKDMKRLAAMTHPDFVLIGTRSTGPFVMHRDEWLDAIQRRDLETIEFDIREVTALGDFVIGTVHARWKLKYLGRVIEDCVLSTDVWVKEDDRWVSIRRHSTPAPAGQCDNLKGT